MPFSSWSGYPVLGLALIWTFFSSYLGSGTQLWATKASYPTNPQHSHFACSVLSNGFCSSYSGKEEGKEEEEEGPYLTLEEKNAGTLPLVPLSPVTETPDLFLGYWLNHKWLMVIAQILWIFFLRESGKDSYCFFPQRIWWGEMPGH